MRRLAEKIDRNVVLCIMEHGAGDECGMQRNAAIPICIWLKIGHEIPFYSTSAGRVFMAYMNRSEALDILDLEKRTKTTPNTKTDLKELNEELDRIHNQGMRSLTRNYRWGSSAQRARYLTEMESWRLRSAFTSMKDGDTEKCSRGSVELKKCAKEISEAIR